jgi:hypothetical protein
MKMGKSLCPSDILVSMQFRISQRRCSVGYLSEVFGQVSDQLWVLSGDCNAVSGVAENQHARPTSDMRQPGWPKTPRRDGGGDHGSLGSQMNRSLVAFLEGESRGQIVESSDSVSA